jgi:ferredoxin
VLAERCYGCGRCLPACPDGLIEERGQVLEAGGVAPLLGQLQPDAVELHTQPGRGEAFAERVVQVVASGVPLQRLAVSAGLEGTAQRPAALAAELWQRFAMLRAQGLRPLWQLDGRPMSGDVGAGTAHAAVKLAAAVLACAPPGPVQLAGGTNAHTLPQLQAAAPLRHHIAGVAFGGVARRLLQPLLLEAQGRGRPLLDDETLWPEALELAQALVAPWLEQT